VTDHEGLLDAVSSDRTASTEGLSGQIQNAGPTEEDDLAAAESLTGLSTDLSLYSLPTVERGAIDAVGNQSQCDSMIDQRQHPHDVPPPIPHSGMSDKPCKISPS
jgi:hypothetical protein